MRVKVIATICATSLALCAFAETSAAGGCFAGFGYGRSPCYPAPIAYGPPEWAQRPYDVSPYPYPYYPLPPPRRQLVQPYEYSHSGWDIYSTYGWDAYAAEGLAAYAGADDGCYFVKVPVLDGRGGWVWGLRAGCF
jgi:hypothetical protein